MVGVKTIWTAAMDQFLIDNRAAMTTRQLGAALGLTLHVTRNRCYELGMLVMEMEYWTKEQVRILSAKYHFWGDVEIAEFFNSVFPEKKKGWTKKHIEKKRRYLKLKRTTEEKKSIHARNTLFFSFAENHYKRWIGLETEIGTVKLWKLEKGERPTLYIKVVPAEATCYGSYIKLARYNWIKVNGQIPEGYAIRHKDGNTFDCNIENLECLTKAENGARNCNQLSDSWIAGITARGDKELKEELLKHPMILDLRRAQIKLNKEIKHAVRKTA